MMVEEAPLCYKWAHLRAVIVGCHTENYDVWNWNTSSLFHE